MARVQLTDDALEDLRDLDGSSRKAVVKALAKLETCPEQRGAPLGSLPVGNLTGFRKLVVGDRDYRIVYRVDPGGDVTVVWVIARRADREVYDLAVARVRAHPDLMMAEEMVTLLTSVWDSS